MVAYTHAGVRVQQFSSENGTIRKLFMTKIEKKANPLLIWMLILKRYYF